MHGRPTDGLPTTIEHVDLRAPAPPTAELSRLPGRVVRWYATVAASWIVLSDLAFALRDGEALGDRIPELAKGLAFVAVTTLLLWLVLRRLTSAHDEVNTSTVTAQRDFFETVLGTSSDLIAIFGPRGGIQYANRASLDILGWSPEEMIGRRGRDFVHDHDVAAALAFMENVVSRGAPARSPRTFSLRHADGSYRSIELSAAPISFGAEGSGVVMNARDVTERVRSEQQLRAALAEDVTGLPNLRSFAAEMAVLDEVRSERASVTAVLVDIDRFADVNALHGRSAGDQVLREVAQRVEAALPQAVGVWRSGVDQFLAVVFDHGPASADTPPTTPPAKVAAQLRTEVTAPIALGEATTPERVTVRVSIGVAQLALDGRSSGRVTDDVVRAAEAALAEAKGHPDRTALHLRSDTVAEAERARLVADLHDAIGGDQLVVRYQPKVRLIDGAVVGAEALIRWRHPERGLLDAGEFLPLVEAANLSGPLTGFVLRRSLDQVDRWLAIGCEPDFAVSVNVSLDDLRRTPFVDEVLSALDRSAVEPRRLTLEITEQTMLADPAGAQAAVDQLREAGVRIAIDDFGTGFSALEHIRLFTVDELKVDKSFVQQLTVSPADEVIVDSILAIGNRLGVVVTAEGIEDAGALEHLHRNGCALGQGYLFSPPLDVDDFDPLARYAVDRPSSTDPG